MNRKMSIVDGMADAAPIEGLIEMADTLYEIFDPIAKRKLAGNLRDKFTRRESLIADGTMK